MRIHAHNRPRCARFLWLMFTSHPWHCYRRAKEIHSLVCHIPLNITKSWSSKKLPVPANASSTHLPSFSFSFPFYQAFLKCSAAYSTSMKPSSMSSYALAPQNLPRLVRPPLLCHCCSMRGACRTRTMGSQALFVTHTWRCKTCAGVFFQVHTYQPSIMKHCQLLRSLMLLIYISHSSWLRYNLPSPHTSSQKCESTHILGRANQQVLQCSTQASHLCIWLDSVSSSCLQVKGGYLLSIAWGLV